MIIRSILRFLGCGLKKEHSEQQTKLHNGLRIFESARSGRNTKSLSEPCLIEREPAPNTRKDAESSIATHTEPLTEQRDYSRFTHAQNIEYLRTRLADCDCKTRHTNETLPTELDGKTHLNPSAKLIPDSWQNMWSLYAYHRRGLSTRVPTMYANNDRWSFPRHYDRRITVIKWQESLHKTGWYELGAKCYLNTWEVVKNNPIDVWWHDRDDMDSSHKSQQNNRFWPRKIKIESSGLNSISELKIANVDKFWKCGKTICVSTKNT